MVFTQCVRNIDMCSAGESQIDHERAQQSLAVSSVGERFHR